MHPSATAEPHSTNEPQAPPCSTSTSSTNTIEAANKYVETYQKLFQIVQTEYSVPFMLSCWPSYGYPIEDEDVEGIRNVEMGKYVSTRCMSSDPKEIISVNVRYREHEVVKQLLHKYRRMRLLKILRNPFELFILKNSVSDSVGMFSEKEESFALSWAKRLCEYEIRCPAVDVMSSLCHVRRIRGPVSESVSLSESVVDPEDSEGLNEVIVQVCSSDEVSGTESGGNRNWLSDGCVLCPITRHLRLQYISRSLMC